MSIFNREDKKSNAVNINDVRHFVGCGWGPAFSYKRGFKPFGETWLWMALNQIQNGVSNLTFETTRKSQVANNICDFIDRNASLLVNQWLSRGFMCVMYDSKGNYRLPDQNELRFDQFGRVLNAYAVVVYSPIYQIKRKSYMQLAKPIIDLIDTYANTMAESCNTMGVLPIISGQSIPANPKFKQELSAAMSKDYGWGEDQLKYFLSQSELKVDTVDLHIKDLELNTNLNEAFKYLLDFFEVPVDLVLGNSTYANVESAKIYFYESTIRKYAEVMLKIARALLTASDELLPQNTITYRITNVAGLDKTLSDKCAQRVAYIDALLKLGEAGVDIEDDLEKIHQDLKRDYIEC